jgi:hypothetical protein
MAKENQTDKGIQRAQGIANPMRKRLYTIKEAALYLGQSEWGMRKLIWDSHIPAIRLKSKSKIYVDINDMETFIRENKRVDY